MRLLAAILLVFVLITPVLASVCDSNNSLQDGAINFEKGKYEIAIRYYKRAIQVIPKCAEAYLGIGMSYLKLGSNDSITFPEKLTDALVAFNNAIDINNNLDEAHYGKGMASLFLDDKKTAIEELQYLESKNSNLCKKLQTYLQKYVEPMNNIKFIESYNQPEQRVLQSQRAYLPSNSYDIRKKCIEEADKQVSYPSGTTTMSAKERHAAEAEYELRKISFVDSCMGRGSNVAPQPTLIYDSPKKTKQINIMPDSVSNNIKQPTQFMRQGSGAINPQTGEVFTPAGRGYVGTRDGTFYSPAGTGGVINTRTGEYIPYR